MTFTTLTFGLFLVLVFALYWSVRGVRGQNLVLVAASYVFYGWWDPRFCALLVASSLIDFGIARRLEGAEGRRQRRLLVAASCVLNLGLLGLFKYYGFFVASFVDAGASLGLELDAPSLELILPVGISFYTFQTLGYTIDVYRGDAKACRRPLD